MPKKEDIEVEIKKANHSKKDIEIEFKKSEGDKESESSEDLEELVEEINPEQFRQFMGVGSRGSPVLGQIAIAPEIVTSGPVRASPDSAGAARDTQDQFKYDAFSSARSDEPKYIQAEHASARLERQNIIEVGRDPNILMPRLPDQESFAQRASALSQRGFSSMSVEKYATPERFDHDKAGRKSHFEQQKDTKYDPKLPRS